MELQKDLKRNKVYDGSTDVKTFLSKIEIEASLKEYDGEKSAKYLASKLIGPAFYVYQRLSDDHKKDFDKVKEELSKEFERGQLNREEALKELGDRICAPDESPETFAYKLIELVKLAYPSFADNVRKAIAKDYFLRGVHPDMQVALKSRQTFEQDDISTLASETVRLGLAGIKSYSKTAKAPLLCGNIDDNADMINSIADVVVEKLKNSSFGTRFEDDRQRDASGVNSAEVNQASYGRSNTNFNRGRRGGQAFNRRGRGSGNFQTRKCRSCQSTDHLIKQCPKRRCQACGEEGHDHFDQRCQNYSR